MLACIQYILPIHATIHAIIHANTSYAYWHVLRCNTCQFVHIAITDVYSCRNPQHCQPPTWQTCQKPCHKCLSDPNPPIPHQINVTLIWWSNTKTLLLKFILITKTCFKIMIALDPEISHAPQSCKNKMVLAKSWKDSDHFTPSNSEWKSLATTENCKIRIISTVSFLSCFMSNINFR